MTDVWVLEREREREGKRDREFLPLRAFYVYAFHATLS